MIMMIIIIIDCLFVNEHQNWELQNQLKSLLQSMLTTSSLKMYSSREKNGILRWLNLPDMHDLKKNYPYCDLA